MLMENSARIYILEDEKSVNELINYALSNINLNVFSFYNSKELFKALNEQKCDILVLDIMLPNQDGFSVLKELKENANTKDIEVILLSALDSEFNKVKGLDLGASDYITKPFSMLEFIARIKGILRRINKDDVLVFKNLHIDFKTRQVMLNNEDIKLTLKEFELLALLIKNPKKCFSKEELLDCIWKENFKTRTIDIHINTLRAKLKDYAKYIKTIHCVGYRFDLNA